MSYTISALVTALAVAVIYILRIKTLPTIPWGGIDWFGIVISAAMVAPTSYVVAVALGGR